MTNQSKDLIWKYLDATHLQTTRNRDGLLIIWTPGNVTQDAHDLEIWLLQHNIRMVSQEFDKLCGKTANVFRGI